MNINDASAPGKALEEAEEGKRMLSVFKYGPKQIVLHGSMELPPPPIQVIKKKILEKKV